MATESTTGLPSFLKVTTPTNPYVNALFPHDRLGGSAPVLWWSSALEDSPVLIFIPGNPGLVGFYSGFLSALHAKTQRQIAILAHAHLGHELPMDKSVNIYNDPSSVGLRVQVESAIDVVDAVTSSFGVSTKIIVAGHSVGAYVALQVLAARPNVVSAEWLLFPTIAHIAQTPNGRSLSRLFRSPVPRILSWASPLCRVLPSRVLAMLFPDWPASQTSVLRGLINSPSAVYASLTLACDEMDTIKEPDTVLLQQHKHRLHMYFADIDDWVGGQKDLILQSFDPDRGSVEIFHNRSGIPHAFCISPDHADEVAEKCYEWLLSGGFVRAETE